MKTMTLAVTALIVFGTVAVSEAQQDLYRLQQQNDQIQRQRNADEARRNAIKREVQQAIQDENRAQAERERAQAERDRVSRMSDAEKMKLRRTRTDECNTRYAPSERPACLAEMRSVGLEPLR